MQISILWVICSVLARCVLLKSIYWLPVKEGLFSQFLQLRIIKFISDELGIRKVVIPFITALHHNNTKVSLCDIFEINEDILCLETLKINFTHCRKSANEIRYSYSSPGYKLRLQKLHDSYVNCYQSTIPFLGGETRRDAFLRAVSFTTPNLQITNHFQELFQKYKKDLFNKYHGNNISCDDIIVNYTVVHWRRGDQLTSRCLQAKDNSVNCLSAKELVNLVRSISADELVYVATNEELYSNETAYLKKSGFTVFDNSLSNFDHRTIPAFMIDIQLMLDASTYLTWGVSIINDLVEHERMIRNKTWCVSHDINVSYPTWCWLQHQILQQKEQQYFINNLTLSNKEKQRFLLSHDRNMTTHPLLVSAYDISNMPAYYKELYIQQQQQLSNHSNLSPHL